MNYQVFVQLVDIVLYDITRKNNHFSSSILFQVDIEIWKNEFLLDHLPNDPGHLVAVELDDRVFDLDLGHLAGSLVDGFFTLRRQNTS